jgi:hypothetical protein
MLRPTALLALLSASTFAQQQFIEIPNVFSGPIVWTEYSVIFDADEDGLMDVLFVNAQGWNVPGDFQAPNANPLPPQLYLNIGITGGIPTFVEATSQLFASVPLFHGKHAAVVDVDMDGHEDLVFATAFGDQQRLFRKDPGSGTFVDETFRLPTLVLNGFYTGVGDFDDDGDPDLVIADAGPNTFAAPGGVARLLLNDGTGFFSDEPGRLGAIEKIGSQNAKVVDIDGDLDLDIVVDGKSPATQLYLNDGCANFTLDTTTLPSSSASSNFSTYETEWGDMDGDLDLDGMIMNWGQNSDDAPAEGLLENTGMLQFAVIPNGMSGSNLQDENDFVLYDVDDDGDLDVMVSVLFPGPEKLFVNRGVMGPGFLRQLEGAFTNLLDSTLDIALNDFDGDGRSDAVTVQGEFNNFQNRYYRGVGPVDTTAPVIGRASSLPTYVALEDLSTVIVRAWVQDRIVDDGNSYTDVTLEWVAQRGAVIETGQVPMPHVGGGIYRGVPTPTSGSALLGASLDLTIRATDDPGNTSTFDPGSIVPCGGSISYCTAGVSASGCQAVLSSTGTPSATATSGFSLTANNVEGTSDGLFFFGTNGRQANAWGNGTSLQCVIPPVLRGGLLSGVGTNGQCDGSSTQDLNTLWSLKPAKNPGVGGVTQAQFWYRDPQNTSSQTTSLSDAVEFVVCP